jgi:hypothetical protein
LARFEGVEGAPEEVEMALRGTAVGRALKKRWEKLGVSSMLTTTAAAPAVYAKIRAEERESKAVGEETVVPIILSRDNPDSYRPRDLLGDLGVRGYGELEGVNLRPRPVFAAKILWLTGVEDIMSHGHGSIWSKKSKGRSGIEEVQLQEWWEGELGGVPSTRRVDQQKHGDEKVDKQPATARPKGWREDGWSKRKQNKKEWRHNGCRIRVEKKGSAWQEGEHTWLEIGKLEDINKKGDDIAGMR